MSQRPLRHAATAVTTGSLRHASSSSGCKRARPRKAAAQRAFDSISSPSDFAAASGVRPIRWLRVSACAPSDHRAECAGMRLPECIASHSRSWPALVGLRTFRSGAMLAASLLPPCPCPGSKRPTPKLLRSGLAFMIQRIWFVTLARFGKCRLRDCVAAA